MLDGSAAENDASSDVDEISSGNDVADGFEEGRHGLAWEYITGEENTWQNRQKCELHGFHLRVRLAGDQDAQRERGEEIGQGEQGEQKHAAVDWHAEEEAHKSKNQAKLEEPDAQVGKQFAEKEAVGTHRSDE